MQSKAMANSCGLTESLMKDNGKTTCCTVAASTGGPTVGRTWVSIRMTENMAKGQCSIRTAPAMKGYGITASSTAKAR